MKKTIIYITALALGCGTFTSCDDDFERPPMVVPVSPIKANTDINDLKAKFYNSESNYATEIPAREDGSHYIISGRVISSDEAGNFFKQIVIDNNGQCIQLNVDAYDLFESYQYGQEIVVDVTGLYIGGYGNLMQIGAAPSSGYPSRIASDTFEAAAHVNGLAEPGEIKVDTVTIAELNDIKADHDKWLQWQCRTVAIKNVSFNDAGKATLAQSGQNTSRTMSDGTGSIILYTSGYSDFWDYYCPEGAGTVVGILSCYRDNWQIRLNDIEGLQGYELNKEPGQGGNPGEVTGDGSEEKPFSVTDVQGGATGTDVWVKGFIVGWVEGQVLKDGAHFNDEASVVSNILLAPAADVTDVAKCIPVQLPAGSEARTHLNLKDNKGVYKKEVMVKGSLESYFGVPAVKNVSAYKGDGLEGTPDQPVGPVTSLDVTFEGSTALPAGWTQVQIAGNKTWYVTSFNNNNYVAMTGYKGTAPFDQWLISPAVDMAQVADKVFSFTTQVNGYQSTTSVLEVYVLDGPDPKTANRTKLTPTLATPPASGYSDWANSGNLDLAKFTGKVYIAFRYAATADANYATWCVDNIKLNAK